MKITIFVTVRWSELYCGIFCFNISKHLLTFLADVFWEKSKKAMFAYFGQKTDSNFGVYL